MPGQAPATLSKVPSWGCVAVPCQQLPIPSWPFIAVVTDANIQKVLVKVADTEEYRLVVLRDTWAPTELAKGAGPD